MGRAEIPQQDGLLLDEEIGVPATDHIFSQHDVTSRGASEHDVGLKVDVLPSPRSRDKEQTGASACHLPEKGQIT